MARSSTILACIAAALTIHQNCAMQVQDSVPMKDISHMYPKGNRHLKPPYCMQGETEYMKDVLSRLQNSSEQLGWVDTEILPGVCSPGDTDYQKSEHCCRPHHCFVEATYWLSKNPPDWDGDIYLARVKSSSEDYIELWSRMHPNAPPETIPPPVECDVDH